MDTETLKVIAQFAPQLAILAVVLKFVGFDFKRFRFNGKNGNGHNPSKEDLVKEAAELVATNHLHDFTTEFRAFKEEMIKHNAFEVNILSNIERNSNK